MIIQGNLSSGGRRVLDVLSIMIVIYQFVLNHFLI